MTSWGFGAVPGQTKLWALFVSDLHVPVGGQINFICENANQETTQNLVYAVIFCLSCSASEQCVN